METLKVFHSQKLDSDTVQQQPQTHVLSLGHSGRTVKVGLLTLVVPWQGRSAVASPACLLFSGRPKDVTFPHWLQQSFTHMGPTGHMALLEWHKGVTCNDFPRLPPGKVPPKMHPPPGFRILLARCTRHLLNSSLACLLLLRWVM